MKREVIKYLEARMLGDADEVLWTADVTESSGDYLLGIADGMEPEVRIEIRVRTRYKDHPTGDALPLVGDVPPEGDKAD